MATDDKNNDKEQDDFFGDDEDFGLPELDYEALDDDDDSDQVDEPKKEAEAEKVEEESPKAEATDDESEMDAVFEGESMDMDEEEIPDQISDEELEASLEGEDLGDLGDMEDLSDMGDLGDMEDLDDADLGDMDMDDMPDPDDSDEEETKDEGAAEEFYEEESFDDFEASDESDDGEEIPDSVFDSDVLDEDEFAQFEKELMDSEQEQTADVPKFESSPASSSSPEGKSKFVKVVVFGILIFAALGTIFWWMAPLGGEEEQPVAEKVERPVEKPAEEKPVEKPAEEATTENNTASENQPETKPAETQPKSTPANTRPAATQSKPAPQSNPGTVNALSARTGNFYIVIGSFLDGDMAVDYANELAGQGKSPSIIPPFGNAITHRVAISGYASLAEAQRSVDGLKADYGQDIWILKY